MQHLLGVKAAVWAGLTALMFASGAAGGDTPVIGNVDPTTRDELIKEMESRREAIQRRRAGEQLGARQCGRRPHADQQTRQVSRRPGYTEIHIDYEPIVVAKYKRYTSPTEYNQSAIESLVVNAPVRPAGGGLRRDRVRAGIVPFRRPGRAGSCNSCRPPRKWGSNIVDPEISPAERSTCRSSWPVQWRCPSLWRATTARKTCESMAFRRFGRPKLRAQRAPLVAGLQQVSGGPTSTAPPGNWPLKKGRRPVPSPRTRRAGSRAGKEQKIARADAEQAGVYRPFYRWHELARRQSHPAMT